MILLLPGIQAGPPELGPLTRLLPSPWRVLPLPDSTEDRLPRIAEQVLDGLGPGPFDVVGVSFGGLVAWAMPPGRVRRLLTIGTLPERNTAARRSGRVGRVLDRVPRRLYEALYAPRVRGSLQDDGADEALIAEVRTPRREVLAARLRAIGGWELPPRPPCPATWMWGATDRFVTWDVARVRALGMTPIVVPGGHRPHLSHPSEVLRWIGPA
jgi:pimeloyl-ACP methyl ester carboxylesterase